MAGERILVVSSDARLLKTIAEDKIKKVMVLFELVSKAEQEIQERFGFSPATVTNYTILYLLEREGLVEKTEMRNNDERIDRKYYIITKFGEKVMNEAEKYLQQTYQKLFSKEIDK